MRLVFKYWVWIMAVIVIALFLWLRFVNINDSFMFTGDPGRDMLVLWDWKETGKPPLLGPQTSAMPLNQSAVYFYMLYPVFRVTNGSPLSANYTVALFWIASLIMGLWLLRKRQDMQWVALIVFALGAIHPLFVEQTRTVWNPSFLPPLLTAGFVSLFLLEEKYSLSRLILFSLSMGLAVSLHFPAGAFLVASLIYVLVYWKKNRLEVFLAVLGAIILFNLPTIAFETRHEFLITRNVLSGNWLGTDQFIRLTNITRLIDFSGGLRNFYANLLFVLALTFYSIRKMLRKEMSLVKMVGYIFLTSIILTILSKLAFHSHYAFGFVVAMFFIISQLPSKILLLTLLLLEVIWINPNQTASYFASARIPLSEMDSCMAMVCQDGKEPIFVSVQSGVSPFHVGYEYRYLLKKNGCDVKTIETEPEAATKMAVIVDESTFELENTSYHELTLFGPANEEKRMGCGNKLGVVILTKDQPMK